MDIDLVDPDRYASGGIPHDQFHRLRHHDPVHRHSGDPDFWAVTRYDDVVHVSRHPEIFSSYRRLALFYEPTDEHLVMNRMMMLNQDPPEHTRKRSIVNKGFTPRTIGRLEDHVREICRSLIDEVAGRGEADFVHDLSAPLPLYVICELIGAPVEDREKIFEWSNRLIGEDDRICARRRRKRAPPRPSCTPTPTNWRNGAGRSPGTTSSRRCCARTTARSSRSTSSTCS
ncbi:hypothetical protein [Actinoallomurus sp. NPDC050550]|uniref:hypothetical protein n=1 Tax=Actinoallomurus sp. NPDC050550 TaxID=3154937 RepID=UPI0033C01904